MACSLLVTVAPAAAATSLAVFPATQAGYTVGEDGVATINILNTSTGLEATGSLTLNSFTVFPSCEILVQGTCASGDPGVFQITGATGSGGACEGIAFTASTVVPPGTAWSLSPASNIVLGPPGSTTSTCQVILSLDVLERPSHDTEPGTPGRQTTMLALAGAVSSVNGTQGLGAGVAVTTVNRAIPTLTTLADPPTVFVGMPIHDTATVTGVPGAPAPTSGVTFTVYADPPGATPVLGPAQDLGLVGLTSVGGTSPPRSTATSPEVIATGEGTFRFVASYIGDPSYDSLPITPCGAPGENVTVGATPGRYTPLTPTRILDTRVGTGGISSPIGPGTTATLPVAGRGGVPASGVGAVAMNVTVTQPTAANSFLTIFPSGQPLPLASNLNFTAGKTVPNLVIARLGSEGSVDMYNAAGSVDVVVDVAGWFSSDPAVGEGRLQPLLPARILDTRTGTGAPAVRLGPGGSLDLQVAGQGGVPVAGAGAVVMNVAVTNTTGAGYLTVHPTGEARPHAANLNWVPGDTVSNRVIAKLGSEGRVTIYNNAGDADVVVDVNAWFTATAGPVTTGGFVSLTPAPILDTRTGAGGPGPLAAGGAREVQVTGVGGVPVAGVSAVVVNITAVTPAGAGFLTAFPTGASPPLASDLNYAPGGIRPNLAIVRLGTGGRFTVFTSSATDLVVDVAGWFLSGELAGDRAR